MKKRNSQSIWLFFLYLGLGMASTLIWARIANLPVFPSSHPGMPI